MSELDKAVSGVVAAFQDAWKDRSLAERDAFVRQLNGEELSVRRQRIARFEFLKYDMIFIHQEGDER